MPFPNRTTIDRASLAELRRLVRIVDECERARPGSVIRRRRYRRRAGRRPFGRP